MPEYRPPGGGVVGPPPPDPHESLLTQEEKDQLATAYRRAHNIPVGATWENRGDPLIATEANVVYVPVMVSGTIKSWVVHGSAAPGSCIIDVLIGPGNIDQPTASICGPAKPQILGAGRASSTDLDDWTDTEVVAGTVLGFRLVSCSGFSKAISIVLEIEPTPPPPVT